ncbi:hypothetical protein NDU88_001243 [Pleurodeles waltl]|uniref:Uncharacterized protein n=1 Tax=Pleurodeles waltl TaxID=8319 RepID=A0AAV7VZX0_PLEWA|nr:hypothetical protein NDU88_001243 [Pleurodeles waltl]
MYNEEGSESRVAEVQEIVDQQSQTEGQENEQQDHTRSQGQEEGSSRALQTTELHELTDPQGLGKEYSIELYASEHQDHKEPQSLEEMSSMEVQAAEHCDSKEGQCLEGRSSVELQAPEHHAHKESQCLKERGSMELQYPGYIKPKEVALLREDNHMEAQALEHKGPTKIRSPQELASNDSQDKKQQTLEELQKVGKQLIRELIFCGILCILHTLEMDMVSSFVCLSLYLSIFCISSIYIHGTVKKGFGEGHNVGEPHGQEQLITVEQPITGSQSSVDVPGPEPQGARKLTDSEQHEYKQEYNVTCVIGNQGFKDWQVIGVKCPKE